MKRLIKILLSIIILLFLYLAATAQEERRYVRKGNSLYQLENYALADSLYSQALDAAPNLPEGYFNRGNARLKLDSLGNAISDYELAAKLAEDPQMKGKAFHNLGNAYFQQEKYQESVDAYKDALRHNPGDMDSKYNLSLAKKKLIQQQQQQDKQQQKDKKDQQKGDQGGKGDQKQQEQKGQDNENKEGKEEKSGKDNKEERDTEMDNPDMKPGDKEEEKEKDQQPQALPGRLSKEEAQKLLEALENEEKKVQEKMIKKQMPDKRKEVEKDW